MTWQYRGLIGLGIFVGLGCFTAWWLVRSAALSESADDHGQDRMHSHTHLHDGQLSHDHSHPGVSKVSHSHAHQHGHEHPSSTPVDSNRELVQIGHVHGDEIQTYWAEITRDKDAIELRFVSETGGIMKELTIDGDDLEAELFFETRSLGNIRFSESEGKLRAKLPDSLPHFGTGLVVIPQAEIDGKQFDFKLSIPKD